MEKGNKKLHFFDRYVGIPIVMTFGLFRYKAKNTNLKEINKIAFLNLGSIGDTALLFGIIKDVRKKYPFAEIFFLPEHPILKWQGFAMM